MFQESEEEDDDSDTNPDSPRSARKRKQGKLHCHNNRNLTSPTSSPSKRARKLHATSPNGAALPENLLQCSSAPAKICQNSPALDLLESKKKVQRNSLYHWVLWREALRGEKDRVTTHPRRLSFNWKYIQKKTEKKIGKTKMSIFVMIRTRRNNRAETEINV